MSETTEKPNASTGASLTFGKDRLTIPLQGTNLAIMLAILWQLIGAYRDLPDQVEQIANDVQALRSNDQEQATQIGKLEAKVETLEDANEKLDDRIDKLEEELELEKHPQKSVAELDAQLNRLKKCIADGTCGDK